MNGAASWLVIWRALVGTGVLGWELGLDNLHHWPLILLAVWLLGAPLEEVIRLITSGHLQITVLREERRERERKQADEREREEEP